MYAYIYALLVEIYEVCESLMKRFDKPTKEEDYFKGIIRDDGKVKALPLLFDNLEIDINISEFKMSGLDRIATWKDIEQLARKIHTEEYAPISFAGAVFDALKALSSVKSSEQDLKALGVID